MSDERTVELFLLGQRVYLRTSLSEETVKEIETLLRQKEREILQKRPFLPPMKVALLMLLQIAEDYVKIEKEIKLFREAVLDKVSRLDEFIKKEKVPWGVRD